MKKMQLLLAATLVAAATSVGIQGGVISVKPTAQKCGVGEEWSNCYSGSCKEATCENGNAVDPGPMCTMDCRRGCKCMSGHARNGKECVRRNLCGNGGVDEVTVDLCPSSDASVCKMMCQSYTCKKGQCAMLVGSMPCCSNYKCVAEQDDPSNGSTDPRCKNKACGDVCAKNGNNSGGAVSIEGGAGGIAPVGIGITGRRLTSIMAPQVTQYCQKDGSCSYSPDVAPNCGNGPLVVPPSYPDSRCPAKGPGNMMSICSVDKTCNVKGQCENMGKICCKRACGGLECVDAPSTNGECEKMKCDANACCDCNNGIPAIRGCAPFKCANGNMPSPRAGECCATPDQCQDVPQPCTKIAKVCPDGSSVSRDTNMNCEFPDCPVVDDCAANQYVGMTKKQLKKASRKQAKILKKCKKFQDKLAKAAPGSKVEAKVQKKLGKLDCQGALDAVDEIEAAKNC